MYEKEAGNGRFFERERKVNMILYNREGKNRQ